MSLDNRDQRVDQLLQGIYRLCVNTDDCSSCPFYVTKCTFGEPRPRSWFDEETIEIKAEADPTPVEETETETPLIKAIENAIEAPKSLKNTMIQTARGSSARQWAASFRNMFISAPSAVTKKNQFSP